MNEPLPRQPSTLDYLHAHARARPHAEAAIEGGLRLSYGDLSRCVELVAAALRARGIGPGQVLAYIGPPGVQYLVSLLAAFAAEATWVGLNPKYRSAELAYVIGHARPTAIVVASTADPRTRSELALALAASGWPGALAEAGAGTEGLQAAIERLAPAATPPQAEIVQMRAAVLVYTSGSTGEPKGACLTQSNLVENAWWLARRLGFESGRFLINLPVNHAGCIADTTLPALIEGDALVFMPAFDAAAAGRLIRDERITTLGQVPTQYQMMASAGVLTAEYMGSVLHLGWGGAAMPESLIATLSGFIPDLFNSYGLTESSGTVTITPPGASVEQLARSVGVPVFEGALRIVDAGGLPIANGDSGEVQISGPHVFPGYLRNERATGLALSSDGWLKTGDTGQWTADGALRLVGRMTEMYKSGGYNIYPREIEAVLESHPGVAMAAVMGVADPLWGEAGCAFVLAPEGAVAGASLEALCRERLAAYKVPKRFEVRADLPLLPIGKIDRKRLLALIS